MWLSPRRKDRSSPVGAPGLHAREGRQERTELLRLGSRQGDGRDPRRLVVVALEFRVPEVFRIMLLADEEARLGGVLGRCEGQGEGDLGLAAVGSAPGSLEVERLEGSDALLGEESGIRLGVLAVEHQHGQALRGRAGNPGRKRRS